MSGAPDEDAESGPGGVSGSAAEGRPRLRTLRLDLEYDGTDFVGWQRQAEGRTVQGEVESALARVLVAPHGVVGCGRTDAGVHAAHYVASFRTRHGMPAGVLHRALDAVLPPDVGVRGVREAPDGFHARRDAVWKWYRYSVLRTRTKRPLARRRTWRLAAPLDPEALAGGAAALAGRHDFRSFAGAESASVGSVRTIHVATWVEEGDLLHLDVVGDGFLHKMVRTIVGTLVRHARDGGGRGAVEAVLAARDRAAAGPVAPAAGLCLEAVAIRGEPPPAHLPPAWRSAVESIPRQPSGGPP